MRYRIQSRVVAVSGSEVICGCIGVMLQLLVIESGVEGTLWTRRGNEEDLLASRERQCNRLPVVVVDGAAMGQQQLVLVAAARGDVDEALGKRL